MGKSFIFKRSAVGNGANWIYLTIAPPPFGIYLRIANRINKSSKLALSFLLRIRILVHSDCSKMRYFNLLNNCPPFLKGGREGNC